MSADRPVVGSGQPTDAERGFDGPEGLTPGQVAQRLIDYCGQFIPRESQPVMHKLTGWLTGMALRAAVSRAPAAGAREDESFAFLLPYLHHDTNCAWHRGDDEGCNCGLAKSMSDYRRAAAVPAARPGLTVTHEHDVFDWVEQQTRSGAASPPAGARARAKAAELRAFGQSAYDAKNYDGGFHCFLQARVLEELADELDCARPAAGPAGGPEEPLIGGEGPAVPASQYYEALLGAGCVQMPNGADANEALIFDVTTAKGLLGLIVECAERLAAFRRAVVPDAPGGQP